MRKRTIDILLALLLALLLVGCAEQEMEESTSDAAETEQIVQKDDEKEELPPLPEEKLYSAFDTAYSLYKPMGFEPEESIGYELYEVSKMLLSYSSKYAVPSEADAELQYRAWRSGRVAKVDTSSSLPDEGKPVEAKPVEEAGSEPVKTEQPKDDTTPPAQTEQPPKEAVTQPGQYSSLIKPYAPVYPHVGEYNGKPIDLDALEILKEGYPEYSEEAILEAFGDRIVINDRLGEYNGQPIDLDYLDYLKQTYPELTEEEVLSLFGHELYVMTPVQVAEFEVQAKYDAEAAERWFSSN